MAFRSWSSPSDIHSVLRRPYHVQGAPALVPQISATGSSMKATTSRDILAARWIHSHEEDTETDMVFRPPGFTFLPSSGRDEFELRPDGSYIESGVGPDSTADQRPRVWSLEAGSRLIIRNVDDKPERVLSIVSASTDRLVLDKNIDASAHVTANNPRPTLLTAQFLRNWIAILVSGIAISVWLHEFTELFPAVITALGLGEILMWVGYVSPMIWSLVGEERRKAIRAWAARSFEGPRPERLCIYSIVVLLVVSLFLGSVRVENKQGTDTIVRVTDSDPPAHDGGEVRVVSNGERNFLQGMWPWQSRTVTIKVDSLPSHEVSVFPRWRTLLPKQLQIPGSNQGNLDGPTSRLQRSWNVSA